MSSARRAAGALIATACLLGACHSAAPRSGPAAVEDRHVSQSSSPDSGGGHGLDGFAPLWTLQEEHWPGQRTMRLSYDDGGGDVTLYIVWRIATPQRYSLLAKDRLGRSWWSLAVDGDDAVAAELRAGTYCHYRRVVELEALPLGPLDFGVVPLLLVGQAPVRPKRLLAAVDDEVLRVIDTEERTWQVAFESTPLSLAEWTLFDGAEPLAWYKRTGDVHRLSSRAAKETPPDASAAGKAGLQLRWKLGRLQPAELPPLPVAPPEGLVLGDCAPHGLAKAAPRPRR